MIILVLVLLFRPSGIFEGKKLINSLNSILLSLSSFEFMRDVELKKKIKKFVNKNLPNNLLIFF